MNVNSRSNIFHYILALGCLALVPISMYGQSSPAQTENEFDSIYQSRITQEMLFGIYIPNDLQDAFRELERLSAEVDLRKFRSAPEALVVQKLHFGLGRWIAHNWGFYSGSRFSHYLKEEGLHNPDNMIRFVLTTFHRHLNQRPILMETLIADLKEQERFEKELRILETDTIKQEKRVREN